MKAKETDDPRLPVRFMMNDEMVGRGLMSVFPQVDHIVSIKGVHLKVVKVKWVLEFDDEELRVDIHLSL